jgi:hypothetical protein
MNIQVNFTLQPDNPDHIAFAKWHDKANQDDILNAMICGYHIYKNIDSLKPGTNTPDTDLVNKIKKEHHTHIQSIYEQHSKDIEQYRHKLSIQYDEWVSKYDKLLNSYNEYIKNELNNIKDHEIQTLKSQLTVFQNTNIYKGEQGEKTINNILLNNFIGYEIKDTSSQTNFADIHLIDRNGFLIAIESKNKAVISTQDVSKSQKDIINLKAKFQDKFIGYVFISLRSPNIPKKGDIYYELIENIPTIWYGTNNSQIEDIVNLIKILYMHPRNISETDNSQILNEHIKKIYDVKKNINDILNLINALKTNVSNLKLTIDQMYDDLYTLIGKEQISSYICEHCQAVYKRKGDLLRHINTKHSV